MQDHVGEDKVRECSLWTDPSKLGLVGRVDLGVDNVLPLTTAVPGHPDSLTLTCSLRQTPSTKEATLEMKPERKALNGKVPTRQQ